MVVKRIIIGSTNPVKIESTRLAFEKIFSDGDFDHHGEGDGVSIELQMIGLNVPSGVPDQPHGDEETTLGAKIELLQHMIFIRNKMEVYLIIRWDLKVE